MQRSTEGGYVAVRFNSNQINGLKVIPKPIMPGGGAYYPKDAARPHASDFTTSNVCNWLSFGWATPLLRTAFGESFALDTLT